MSGVTDGSDFKEKLIASVKKEVKQVMEEAVTKKFIHEESGSVTALCGAVEACLIQGLRRRALGLFKTSSTTALLHKVAKQHCPEAAYISKKVIDIENSDPNKRSSSSSDSTNKPPILKKNSSNSLSTTTPPSSPPVIKYLWIRLALYEKKLSRIIDHLVTNAHRYYEKDALVSDADYGSILSSLLVGPCALEYSRAKTPDHFWTDPPADELLQRHRISAGQPTPPTCRRPIINFKRSLHTSSEDGNSGSFKSNSSVTAAKDYVESLHQNSKATLLYGKNNVLVLPKDVNEPMPGYLSLHQNVQSLTIKWTPNQLMNGYTETDTSDKSSYWAYSLNINVDEIVYVHCHQTRGGDTGGTVILVGQDGVQRPPIHFPEGGHMSAFLSCLETGLLPHGQLDPPLWSQRGIGRIFPWPLKTRRRPLPSVLESNEETPIDYVFRVVNKSNHEEFLASHPLMEIGRTSPRPGPRTQLSSCSTNDSSDCSTKSFSIDGTNPPDSPQVQANNQEASIALVCTTMRRQIISRAFYGWLAYCRHLSTVRTHLSGLVLGRITAEAGAENGLTIEKWAELNVDGVCTDEDEVFRLVYFGGVQHDLRKEIWPYLLGHYRFGTTIEERHELDEATRHYYETTMSEWLAVEAIVRQRDKEKTAHAVAKLSSESASGDKTKSVDVDGDVDNDVFEENDISDLSEPDVGDEENQTNSGQNKDAGNEEVIEKQDLDFESDEKVYNDNDNTDHQISREDSLKTPTSPKDFIDDNGIGLDEATTPVPPPELNNLELNLKENCFEENHDFDTLANGDGVDKTSNRSSPSTSSYVTVANDLQEFDDAREAKLSPMDEPPSEKNSHHAVIITNPSIDVVNLTGATNSDNSTEETTTTTKHSLTTVQEAHDSQHASLDALQEPRSACVSPASSNGGIYSSELLETFGLNLHRIEKDVQRCDRNYWYFANENLDKLRNVICTYVWEHLDVGYMQGMCDLVAPLLVIFDDESLSYGCFCRLMERMIENFPNGGAMDMHFANMRSLIQILDSEMYDLMHAHGDYTHFYFCYRWFLLDFKRELIYADIFATWEVIWAAKHVASSNFVLFLALALLETYRDIILSNSMDFTDVIKFFNEMAERHNTAAILKLARSLVLQLQTLIENK